MPSTPYAQPSDLREYLTQKDNTPADDSVLATILERATAIVNLVLGFEFAPIGNTATTKTIEGSGTRFLPIPPHQAGTVTGVVYGDDDTEVDADTYYVTDGGKYLKLSGNRAWVCDYRYTVTAKWGYGEVPADIVEVTLELAVNIHQGKDGQGFTGIVGVGGDGQIAYEKAFSPRQKVVLDAVKRQYTRLWVV